MKLVSSRNTHIAKQSGSWFDPETWVGGKVPGKSARVQIGHGITIRYDQVSTTELDTLNVEGKIQFANNRDTKMVIDTFVVSPGGQLEIGTEKNPVRAGVTTEILIADNGPLDLKSDPGQFGRGLISHGDVQIHGQAKTSHLKVARDPMKGDRTLTLQKTPINWQVGDTIVLTGTTYSNATTDREWEATIQDEEVTIRAINGKTITLDQALKFDHDTPRKDLKAYVANQSRNIIIASENGDAVPIGQRGHTMFMHSDDIDIRYVEFRDLGRTDKSQPLDKNIRGRKNVAGRYAAHIHRTGSSSDPAILVGNVVDSSPGWGFVVHDSKAILENNFAYDVNGGAFVTESGNETGAFRNNISIKTGGLYSVNEKKGTKTHDFARTGVGFWFAGRLVENEGNIAAGSRNSGMFYMHRGSKLIDVNVKDLPIPEAAKSISNDGKTVGVDQPPIQGFKNNEVFASGNGLRVIKNFPEQNNDLRSVLKGFKAWEVEEGTELQYTSHYTLDDFDLVSTKDTRFWRSKGLHLQENTQDMVFNNLSIDGFEAGIVADTSPGSNIAKLKDKGFVWVDLQLKNNLKNLDNISISSKQQLRSTPQSRAAKSSSKLKFELSNDSDLEIAFDDYKDEGYVEIKGTKTDSLGTIKVPFGNEKIILNYGDVINLAKQGYYTLPNGKRAAIVDEFFSDRLTGETIKQSFVVTFKEAGWTKNSPYLGKLNPDSIGGATRVNVPQSRFSLEDSAITPVKPVPPVVKDPVAPKPPVVEDPIAPKPPVKPPVEQPIKPIPLQPSDQFTPTDSVLQPVASYSFKEDRGSRVQDVSKFGKNNFATFGDGADWTRTGKIGGGVELDGKGSVRVRNSTDINRAIHDKRSVSLWFNPDQLAGNGSTKQVIYDEGDYRRGLNIYLEGDDLFVGGWNRSTQESAWDGSWISSKDSIKAGQWHHVALVLSGNETVKDDAFTAYLDGEKIGSEEGSQLWKHSNATGIGNIAGKTRFHNGRGVGSQGLAGTIDEVQIFNQALTTNQVADLAAI
ncbi:MAG: LamG-like jellyroll fold domain-containing protein [Cyanobacteria bacterium P01_D01_bin.1]